MAPQRRTEPKRFLDASLVPLENALRQRAGRLEEELEDEASRGLKPNLIKAAIAEELSVLAEELHHW